VKAEAVLALQLALRHRAVRLAAGLAAVALVLSGDAGAAGALLVLAAGAVGVVAASRPLAPGPAWHAARRAAALPLTVATGRAIGLGLLIFAVAAAALPILAGGAAGGAAWWALGLAVLGGLALSALVLPLAPVLGASAAGAVGLILLLAGQLPPTTVWGLSARWPAVRAPLVLAWNVLPLPWRVEQGAAGDIALLALWIPLGVAAAAWRLAGARARETP
jgi:hypothetical protein